MNLVTEADAYGSGTLAPIGALNDSVLLEQLRRYKRQIAKRYRVIPAERLGEVLPEGRLWLSTKLDGQLWFLLVRDGQCVLCAYNGRVLSGIPLLDELQGKLGGRDCLLAGELYVEPSQGRPRVQHVTTALGDGSRADDLRFKAFDLLEDGDQDGLTLPYEQRFDRLKDMLGDEHVVQTEVLERDEAPRLYREWVLSDEHEGLIARSEQGLTYKIKPSLTLDLVVVAFGARITGETHELREMSLALLNEDGSYQIVGTVGTGFSEEDRLRWHHRLSALKVDSAYRMANSAGTLCHFVKPEVVVEVRCSDLLTLDGGERPIRRMRLTYGDEGYAAIGEHGTAVMLHPRFERERDDKPVELATVGMEQILSRVSLEEDGGPRTAVELAEAEVLKRGVWTKTTKGRQAVRKFVMVATNKDPADGYSPFALFTTDFSPGRAEPLKTALSVAADRETVDTQVASWIDANIKRGWVAQE